MKLALSLKCLLLLSGISTFMLIWFFYYSAAVYNIIYLY